jgi:hypothetical protein
VRLDLELKSMQASAEQRAGLLLQGRQGRSMQARSSNEHVRDKLIQAHAQLRVKLGVGAVFDSSGSAEYAAACSRLAVQEVRDLQRQIEVQATALADLLQQQQREGTNALRRRVQDRRKEIRQLVEAVQQWQKLWAQRRCSDPIMQQWGAWPSSRDEAGLQAQLQKLFEGRFFWRGDGAGAVPVLLAQQFRDACALVSLAPHLPGLAALRLRGAARLTAHRRLLLPAV